MPTVDFTLEDLRKVVKEEIKSELVKEREATKGMIQDALVAERKVTQRMISEGTEDVKQDLKQFVADEFVSFWDNNLGPAFDELHGEFAKLKAQMQRAGRAMGR